MQKGVSRYLAAAIISATLCLALAGPATAAKVSPEPVIPAGDLCGHVQSRDVYALIASPGDGIFSVDSSNVEAGKLTCVWSALKAGASDGSAPDAALTLDLYHFASVARARTELRGFGIAAHAPHAQTGNADDEVIQLSPGAMAARHGLEIAVARATVPQSLVRDPDWNARFEALTLAGAGARLLAPPEPPGAVASTPSPAIAANAWRPPERHLPANSAIFVPVVHVMWQLTHWRFEFVPVAIVVSILIGVVAIRLRRLAILWLVPLIFGYAILNVIFGPDWGVALIYRFGNQAPATVTGTFPTNDIYNDQAVVGYHVLIRPADGAVVEGSFRSDDFNVYPPHNATRYPDSGDVFSVRYLRGYPADFVIVSDDGSPWSNRLRCEALAVAADQADQKAGFAPDNPPFRQAAQAAHAALQSAGCQVDDSTN
ncbi:hypothetical protein WJ542_26600 [Paraburkholderia sp. B3]|uniref:hypothetical protein n=1 Tax=Paraburkholderia sp. B3 TaxID=3134791 RepID=UPI003982040D